MELYTLDRDFNMLGVIRDYESLIWETKTWEHDTASLKCRLEELPKGSVFLKRSDSPEALRITRLNPKYDLGVSTIEVQALGATLFYNNRVNWWTHNWYNKQLGTALRELLDDAQRTYMNINRTIKGMDSIIDEINPAIRLTKQLSWGQCAAEVFKLVKEFESAFTVVYDGQKAMSAKLWTGRDLTHDVVFSDKLGDISKASLDWNDADYKNLAVIAGEGEGSARKVTTSRLGSGELSELYVDAKDIRQDPGGDEPPLTNPQYINALKSRGTEKLSKAPITNSVEIELLGDARFTFNKDYKLGDRVSYDVLGYQGSDVLTEAKETFEQGGRNLEITLGQAAPTAGRMIREVLYEL